ncbi:hypothetical protein [Flagellimonas beolgyonensis]|uniref:hypothetical protein n=1 Tax=Flagellimonas beolgyonensis TaxID=864064 RepID=UPI000F8F24E1|nr:hypothetical protein [Allomuricauda beolgyonensis]
MKLNWFVISFFIGVLAGIICFLVSKSISLSLIIGFLVLLVMMLYNPQRRYIKAFWAILINLILLNRVVYKFLGKIANVSFEISSPVLSDTVSVSLVLLCIITLIFDFIERNQKNASSGISKKENSLGSIKGDGNKINQKIE